MSLEKRFPFELSELEGKKEQEREENLSNPEKVIEGFETGNITLEKIKLEILRKAGSLLPDIIDVNKQLSSKQLKKFFETFEVDEQVGKKMQEVQKYFNILNKFKDSEEDIVNYEGTEYIKNNGKIYEVLHSTLKENINDTQVSTYFITYNHLDKKYTIFSYNGEKVQVELSDIENINFTNIDNWFEIIKKRGEVGLYDKYYKGGYYYIGTNGTKYVDGGVNFSELDSHGDFVIFRKDTHVSNNTLVLSNGKEKGEVLDGIYEKITLSNGKKLILINYDERYSTHSYTLIDLDEMKILIENKKRYNKGQSNLIINKKENIINYITEKPRAFKFIQRLLGSIGVLKTIDLNTNTNCDSTFGSDLKKINKGL